MRVANVALGPRRHNDQAAPSRASPNVNMRWRWIEISPAPIPLSDLVRFVSVAPKKQRLTSVRPCASVRAIRRLISGWVSQAWRSSTSAVTSKRSRGVDGRSRPIEIIRKRIFGWLPPSRNLVDWTKHAPRSRLGSRSIRPSPSPATSPPVRRGATTGRIWPSSSPFSKACARRDCRRNEAKLKAACGSGCNARRLSTGRSIRT